jgi:hypothetical protein
MKKVLQQYSDPGQIPQRNIQFAREKRDSLHAVTKKLLFD